jgi:hypothetical protein
MNLMMVVVSGLVVNYAAAQHIGWYALVPAVIVSYFSGKGAAV